LIADEILVGAQFVGNIEDVGFFLSGMWRHDSLERLRKVISQGNLLSRNPWCYRIYPYIKQLN